MKSSPIFCTPCLSSIRFVAVTANSVGGICYSEIHNNSIVEYVGNFLGSSTSLHSVDRCRKKIVKYDLQDISTDSQRMCKAFSALLTRETLLNKGDGLVWFSGDTNQDCCNEKAKSFFESSYELDQGTENCQTQIN